ncbi:MAG: aldo/keto reductase [Candidatus Hydrogenedentes bacterium]|jgi:aryl-alcohol dehydrogenase-like predicted oxidoreductase|nr:aldo/keto reductase [Candidatus Hydrogenedentota bacterium]
MDSVNRRDFMRQAACAVAAATALPPALATAADTAAPVKAAVARRTLGSSGLSCTRLGLGTGTRAWNKDSAQIRAGRDTFLNTLTRAYEQGIRYFDVSDSYGSHQYLRDAMAASGMKREDMFILTKSQSKTADAIRADLDRMRKEVDTDYFDVVLLHCMTAGDWPQQMAGCMDVLSEAQQKGIIKAKGVSCHHLQALEAAADSDWVDILLGRINPYGTHMDGTREEITGVLGRARTNGKGVIGMKILGEGKHAGEKEACIRFAMEQECLDAFVIGFLNPAEVDDIVSLMDKTTVG